MFTYDNPQECVKDHTEFMIPLGLKEYGEYRISIRAYKAGRSVEESSSLCTFPVKDTVLGKLRTRLR